MATQEEIDAFLAHHGVKGMHWGVRKPERETTNVDRKREISKINKKLDKGDANRIVEGAGLKGFAVKKQFEKETKKNPDFSYQKLSPAQKAEYQRKASRKITRRLVIQGSAETAAILVTGNVALNHVHGHPETINGARLATVLLAGKVGYSRVQQIRSVHESDKHDDLITRRDQLVKETKKAAK